MDNNTKHDIVLSVVRNIPNHGMDREYFHEALVKRFPKAFWIEPDSIGFGFDVNQLTSGDVELLRRLIVPANMLVGPRGFWNVSRFWDALCQEQHLTASEAREELSHIAGISMSEISDIEIDPVTGLVEIHIRGGGVFQTFLETLKEFLSPKHYEAVANRWVSHYGPLYNWL